MADRSRSQKIGAQGHKWLMAHVEEHPHWVSRELSEDFGIDAEFELTEPSLTGDILKAQIKSSEQVERSGGAVKFTIERKYVEYADACRYPLIMVRVDVTSKEAWYLWLQDWLLTQRATGSPLLSEQESWTEWVPESRTVKEGLDGELQKIARWEGEAQLALSLRDALHAATAIGDRETMLVLANAVASRADRLGHAGLNTVIDEAIKLGNRMRGTKEGNDIAEQLFAMVRRLGDRIDAEIIDRLVLRGETYSRAGLTSLAILYDDHFAHISSLLLPSRYLPLEPRVAFYCAYRETYPEHGFMAATADLSAFTFAGMRCSDPEYYRDKFPNRGPSALLDCLEFIEPPSQEPTASPGALDLRSPSSD